MGVHADMLELLECVVGALGHALEAVGMHVGVGDMAVREEGAGRHGLVWRKSVERIRQHVVRGVDLGVGVSRWLGDC